MAESITRKNIDLDILDYYDGKIKNYVDDKVGTGSLTIDDTLSDTSTNPVQNKVVKQAIDNKADSSHTHVKADITDFPASLPANGGDAATVNGHTVESNVPALGYYYATCDSPLTTNIKTVTCEGFEFKEGARITICFTAGNGGNPPSAPVFVLKINEDAGRPIAYNDWDGEGIITQIDSKKSEAFCSNQVWDFIFIKGRFIMQAPLRGYQMDDTLSNSSRNPVQNKIVKQAIDNKADKSKYGDTTIDVGRKAGTTVGKYSTAEGNSTTASGWTSHAEGDGTTASGDYSHAEGKLTTASGYASHTEGNATTASSDYSHAEGKSTAARGLYSHAEGRGTTASGNNSHAEGATTAASNYAAHAEGNETTASGNSSHAEGQSTTASGNCSHAEGNNTTASGNYSHAEGYSSDKVTQLITDFLNGNITKDDIINTWNTKKFSVAHGNESHVEGQDNLSLGHYSHAEGLYTVAIGNQSHTSGYYTKALHDNEAAYGKYNESNDSTLFSVGDGTADDARHNAFEITTTGGKLHDKDIATTDLIPTTLPANGGNADTLNGMDAETIRSMSKNVESGASATSSQLADGTYCGIWADVPSYLSDTQGTLIVSNYHTNGAPSPWSHRIFYSPHYNTIWHGFISNYNWYGWKEISTMPIKSTTFSGTTDAYSNIALWAKSENKIPILFECEDKNATIFYGKSSNFYAYVTNHLHQNVVETAVSGTVWYAEV